MWWHRELHWVWHRQDSRTSQYWVPPDSQDLKCFKWGNIDLNDTGLLRQSVNLGGSVQTEHSTRLLGREAVAETERTCFDKSITWRNYTFGMCSSCTPGYQIWSAADCTSLLMYRVCCVKQHYISCSSLDACSLELYSLDWALRPPLDNVGF